MQTPSWLTVKLIHAGQGSEDAQYQLGCIFYNGDEVKRDFSEAARWFRMAAEQGSSSAQRDLEKMFRDGVGVAQDFSEAFFWALIAAKSDDSGDPYVPDKKFYKDRLTPKQIDAVNERLPKWGPSFSSLKKGMKAYVSGDYKIALNLLFPLAHEGNTDAQTVISWAYMQGKGVKKDEQEAENWTRKKLNSLLSEADQGCPDAQQALFFMYQRGYPGVKQDYFEAYFWAKLTDFNPRSPYRIYGLSKDISPSPDRLTSEQLVQVEKRLEKWKLAHAIKA